MSLTAYLLRAVLSLSCAAPLIGQCQLEWQSGAAVSGISGTVEELVPTGTAGSVYAVGEFGVAGGILANNVAFWNGSSWAALGTGTDGPVYHAVLLPNQDLVVAGRFETVDGIAVDNIARWDGTSWSPLAQGLNGLVTRLLVLPNGDVLATGSFTQSGQTALSRFARWDGAAWSQGPTGMASGSVNTMALLPNGDIVIAGVLFLPGSSPLSAFGIWDGTAWTVPPLGLPWIVHDLAVLPNGDLAIGGILPAGERVAIWDGVSVQFESLPANVNVASLDADTNGDLYVAGGVSTALASPAVFRRSNGSWTTRFSHTPMLSAIAVEAGRVFVASAPKTVLGSSSSVFEYAGASWDPLGGPPNANVWSLAGGANGTAYAGGEFESIEGVAANNIAFFDGAYWHPLGLGVDGKVQEAEVAANGDLIVAGGFANAGGVPANGIARWNGISWSTLGAGIPTGAIVLDLAMGPNGEVALVTHLGVHVFDGMTWLAIPLPNHQPAVLNSPRAIDFLPNGDLVLGGALNGAAVQTWDGVSWTQLGMSTGFLYATELEVTPNGMLVRVVADGAANRVEQWTGSAWQQLGNAISGSVQGLESLPTGQLILAGVFTSPGLEQVAFWDGTSWTTVDGGTGAAFGEQNDVRDVAVNGAGELWLAGTFASIGSQVSALYARAVSTCPATATTFGSGCVGSNGPMTLEPLSNPWLGTAARSRATGFSSISFGLHVLGTNPTVLPLAGGAPGCLQLVDPVLFEFHATVAGAVETSFAVPNTPALAGQSFRTQMIGLELSSSLVLTSVTSTNALDMLIGSY